MDGNQLKYFHTLAAINNFTKAAQELNLSQPALSRSISRLEAELGVPLFERKGRGIIINRYGKIFMHHAKRALLEIDEARRKINDMVDPSHGTVSLSFIHLLGLSFVPDLIGGFRKQEPKIRFQLTQESTEKILDQIESAEIDFGFCIPQQPVDIVNLSILPVMEQEMFLIVPKDHRLAGRQQVDLNEVANEPFVLHKPGVALRDVVKRLCGEAGFEPIPSLEAPDIRTVVGLVGANFGVTLIPLIPALDKEKISILRVRNPRCSIVIKMVWRTNGYMSPAAIRFKSYVEHFLHE